MSDGQGAGPGGSSRRMRVAEVFDGRGPGGGVVVNRPQVNPAELAALTAYLTKAPVALATTKTGEDEMSPGAGLVVPRAYHTDGEWIWPAAVGYYLHRYHLAPQTGLVEHIRARGFRIPAVPEDRRQAAAAQMLEELAAAKRNAASGVGALGASAVGAPAPLLPPAPVPGPAPMPVPVPAPEVAPAPPGLWTPEPVGAPAAPSAASAAPVAPVAPVAQAAPGAPFVEESGDAVPDLVEGETFSPAFTAAGNRHAAWVYEQVETFLDYMPVDEWSVDHESGRYRQAGREFTVDALGRLDQSGRWVWAWAEPEAWARNPALTERARQLREQGDRLGIKELTEPTLNLAEIADADDPEIAAEMLAWTAMGVAGARGYIGHTFSDENRVYYLAFDESIPTAEPDLGAAAHYLTQGADKFEEDPSDCVLGYVEHHGWDWSRSADGIVVSAGRLGTFTANLAPDGALTGVVPNR
ncbi:MAG TPA: hypothetical protein VFN97_21935 [Actinospica sp.]|nr:hypothetical protein [Actinospica sp.]